MERWHIRRRENALRKVQWRHLGLLSQRELKPQKLCLFTEAICNTENQRNVDFHWLNDHVADHHVTMTFFDFRPMAVHILLLVDLM